MSDASKATSALALLTKKGRSVTRRAYTTGTYDTNTGQTSTTYTDTTRKAVILDFGAGATLVRGTLIQGGDKRMLLDAVGAAPAPQDHFIIGSVEYVVVSVGEINPAGTPILYDLHLTT